MMLVQILGHGMCTTCLFGSLNITLTTTCVLTVQKSIYLFISFMTCDRYFINLERFINNLLMFLLPNFICVVACFLCSERRCSHDTQPVTLSELKQSDPGRVHHVRVQLRSYEPRRLHQALKLYCSKCTTM